MRLAQQPDSPIARRRGLNNSCCPVCRTVINDHNFDVPVSLVDSGRKGPIDPSLSVVNRDNDGD